MATTKVTTGGITDATIATADIANDAVTNAKVADDAVGVAELSATGTASSSTFLRGDNSWAAVTSTTINNNADNRVITGSGTANTLEGESNFTWTGSSLELTAGTGNQFPLSVRNDFTPNSQRADLSYFNNATSNNSLRLGSVASNGGVTLQGTRANDSAEKVNLTFNPDGGNVGIGETSPDELLHLKSATTGGAAIQIEQDDGTSYKTLMQLRGNDLEMRGSSGNIEFYTGNNDGASSTERLRIDSSGRLLLGTTTEGHASADDLTVASSASTGITIRSGTSSEGNIYFSKGTSGSDEYKGIVVYDHNTNAMRFYTDTSERMRIDSSGRVGIGDTSPDRELVVKNASSNATVKIEASNAHTSQLFFSDTDAEGVAKIAVFHGSGAGQNALNFETGGSSRLLIDSAGKVGIGTTSPVAQTLAGGTAITPVLDLKGVTQNNTSGILQFTRKDHATQGSCIYSSGDDAGLTFRNTDGNGFGFYNGTTNALRIDASGRVLIGTTTDNGFKFKVSDGGGYEFAFGPNDSGVNVLSNYNRSGSAYVPFKINGSDLRFCSGGDTERMRINSDGDVQIGQTANDCRLGIKQRSSAVDFLYLRDASDNLKMYVHTSGNIYNTNGSYGQISDQSLKENIVDANSQWNDIKNIKIRNFNFTAASGMDTHTQIGCVAQEVETVSPKLVTAPREDGIKTVANSVLYMKAIKALQEAMAKIETLEAKVAALEAK